MCSLTCAIDYQNWHYLYSISLWHHRRCPRHDQWQSQPLHSCPFDNSTSSLGSPYSVLELEVISSYAAQHYNDIPLLSDIHYNSKTEICHWYHRKLLLRQRPMAPGTTWLESWLLLLTEHELWHFNHMIWNAKDHSDNQCYIWHFPLWVAKFQNYIHPQSLWWYLKSHKYCFKHVIFMVQHLFSLRS